MIPKPSSKVRHLSLDRISALPSSTIQIILCLVPIRDAVRTSILSKKWRYKWSTIPKLVFRECLMFDEFEIDGPHQLEYPRNERKELTRKCKLFYAIQQVLLMHHGPIIEFTLDMKADNTCIEIDQLIIYLSRNKTVKKFALELTGSHRYRYKLPLSVFSLHQLSDLTLVHCELDLNPTSSGFISLTSLSMRSVKTCTKTLLRLISSCPLLKSLSLSLSQGLVEGGSTVDIIELSKCLPMIEHLSFDRWTIEGISRDKPPRELPTTLVHLKYWYIRDILFLKDSLIFLLLYIRSSPNLEKIKLQCPLWVKCHLSNSPGSISLDGYSDIWLEHLKEVEIKCFRIQKPELEFVKLILANSPVLEKVRIVLRPTDPVDEESKILRILIHFPCASPAAEIIIDRIK